MRRVGQAGDIGSVCSFTSRWGLDRLLSHLNPLNTATLSCSRCDQAVALLLLGALGGVINQQFRIMGFHSFTTRVHDIVVLRRYVL